MKTNVFKMKLKYIDNSFYRLTPRQAQELSVENRLPRYGHEMRVDLDKLAEAELCKWKDGKWIKEDFKREQFEEAWIKRTPISFHDGKPVALRWVWAVHIRWQMIF